MFIISFFFFFFFFSFSFSSSYFSSSFVSKSNIRQTCLLINIDLCSLIDELCSTKHKNVNDVYKFKSFSSVQWCRLFIYTTIGFFSLSRSTTERVGQEPKKKASPMSVKLAIEQESRYKFKSIYGFVIQYIEYLAYMCICNEFIIAVTDFN